MSQKHRVQKMGKFRTAVDHIGVIFVDFFHLLALFAIGAATVWSASFAFLDMMEKSHASVEDLLLLFIYLEIGAMVGIYFKTSHLPVRFLIYVAITALTRLLVADIGAHHKAEIGLLYVTFAVLILAVAEVLLRYGKSHYPIDTEVLEIQDRPMLDAAVPEPAKSTAKPAETAPK